MADEKKADPCWLYRLGDDNKVHAELFKDGPPDDMKGWHDAPPKKRGRSAAKAKDEPEQ
ncbi:MAG: hypothetical protein ACR2RF_09980 [Geminicoccaceae bacterium]